MKRTVKILLAATIVMAVTTAVMIGCKKNSVNVQKNEIQATCNVNAKTLFSRIEEFQQLRKSVRAGVKTDGTMTLDEIHDIIDLTLNYEHSQHETYCENMVLDTLCCKMPKTDSNGNVAESDVIAVYDAIETELENCLLAVNDGMNVPSYFSIVMPKLGEKDDNEIDVIFLRGETAETSGNEEHTSDGPFSEGVDDWHWGLDLGPCDSTGYTGRMVDAADVLTQQFVFTPDQQHQGQSYIIYMVEHAYYTPDDGALPEDWIYYVDRNMEDCAPRWLFYYEGEIPNGFPEPCIPWDEMNCYWRSIRRNIVLPNAMLHLGPIYSAPYHRCIISDRLYYRQTRREHVAHVIYCYVSWEESLLSPID